MNNNHRVDQPWRQAVLRAFGRLLRPGGRSASMSRRTIVCPCHDATLYDLRTQWSAGFQHAETLKRATAVFMGPCQGKYCAPLVGALVAELTGETTPAQRRPSVRPPLYPVRLGDLADPGCSADPTSTPRDTA